jgi:hypothetical protein
MSRVVVTCRSNASVPDMHIVMPIYCALRNCVCARLEYTQDLARWMMMTTFEGCCMGCGVIGIEHEPRGEQTEARWLSHHIEPQPQP